MALFLEMCLPACIERTHTVVRVHMAEQFECVRELFMWHREDKEIDEMHGDAVVAATVPPIELKRISCV